MSRLDFHPSRSDRAVLIYTGAYKNLHFVKTSILIADATIIVFHQLQEYTKRASVDSLSMRTVLLSSQ